MNHIQIYDNTLSKNTCNNIIKYFDNNPNKQKEKDSSHEDTRIYVHRDRCDDIISRLLQEDILPCLEKGLEKYKKTFPFLNELVYWSMLPTFNIQKFDGDKEGYFAKHCESGNLRTSERMLAWMIYLNNAKCGTRFYHPTKDVEAKQGRLVIWPAEWTYPHSGITPNIGEKYLMTGWYSFFE
tara:strand:- start:92 stop:637 length:546 start_codon:yes stop_codon:yes gene_type:complete